MPRGERSSLRATSTTPQRLAAGKIIFALLTHKSATHGSLTSVLIRELVRSRRFEELHAFDDFRTAMRTMFAFSGLLGAGKYTKSRPQLYAQLHWVSDHDEHDLLARSAHTCARLIRRVLLRSSLLCTQAPYFDLLCVAPQPRRCSSLALSSCSCILCWARSSSRRFLTSTAR